VPISFAALDLINRAEQNRFVGPEAFDIDQQSLVYLAQPVLDEGRVSGVLLVVLPMIHFASALDQIDTSTGTIEVIQRFANTAPRTVLQMDAGGGAGTSFSADLVAPYWSLNYRPAQAGGPMLLSPML
jgi:phosphomannomutase / phosphoglucomutase